uniref:Mitochondrial fission 1 protein n=1 Tax=Panagrolaimus superbus TaxID=310955 RepID=A0A914YNU0_9BILA
MDIGAIVDECVDSSDLEKASKTYTDQARRGLPSALAAFTYAHCLIRSNQEDVKTGIMILEGMLKRGTEDIPKRDYVFYLSIAHTRIKEYDRALAYIQLLLSAESDNRQAIELKSLIESRMKRDGLLGLGIVALGGGAALIAGLAATFLARRH